MLYEVIGFAIITSCQIIHVMLEIVYANVITHLEVLECKLPKCESFRLEFFALIP